MKKKEETLYAVEVKDRESQPWRVIMIFRHRKEAFDNACHLSMNGVYYDVRTAEWVRKEGEQ